MIDNTEVIEEGKTSAGIGISWRAVVIGLLLIPINVYWVILSELRWGVILTLNPLFVTPIFYLLGLVGINVLLRRVAPKQVLKPSEMVIIYIMLVLSCTIATMDYIINLISFMPYARWNVTSDNNWATNIFPYLPKHLLVWNKSLLEGYYYGNSTMYRPAVLLMWAGPLAFWSFFIFTSSWIMFCINVLLRKAWMDNTKLTYPTVRLPFALTEEDKPGSMLRSKVLWSGFVVAAGISSLNQLHNWFPSVPFIQVQPWFIPQSEAWMGGSALRTTFYPFAIGLAFLVPLDISFSCWFFYLFLKLQSVAGFYAGLNGIPEFPWRGEQAAGGWFAFGILLLWSSRKYLKGVLRTAFNNDGSDNGEPISYRAAFWGWLIGSIIFFAFWLAAGMSLFWASFTMFSYFMVSIAITRIRAEAGAQHSVWLMEPFRMVRPFGSNFVGSGSMAGSAVSHWFWDMNRSHMMPAQMEAFKLAKDHGMNLRKLVIPMILAIVIATIVGMWSSLHVLYKDGAVMSVGYGGYTGYEAYEWLNKAVNGGFPAEIQRFWGIGVGAAFVTILTVLRERFAWFPFHPLGFCASFGMYLHWVPFFVAWLIKLVVLRFGGFKAYKAVMPFFIGLILGDYITGAIWSLIGIFYHIPAYQIFG
ncbi:MAG: DUF6785 family protein [bacterium]|jgi:hypothetical protein